MEDFSFETAGLYVHVPFCARHCHYCNFVITTASGASAHRRFLDALREEARASADRIAGKSFGTLYFGGGTPSQLEAEEFEDVINVLNRNFCWADTREVTLEANPDDIDSARVEAWVRAGVRRVSLGAQSFRDQTLQGANRRHDSRQIGEAVGLLRRRGISNINLDLMLSMPGETLEDVKRSVTQLLELNPEHVSLYELVIEPKTVFGKWYGAGAGARPAVPALPNEALQVEMLTTARAMLKKAGYRHYELLNFARPGCESRHNLLYWDNREYLGLGPGAYSYVNGRRFRLASTVEEYYRKVEGRDWKPEEEEVLPAQRREAESFVLALRLEEGAKLTRFKDVIESKKDEIASLVEKGLVESDPRGVRLTERGKLFAETVFSELV